MNSEKQRMTTMRICGIDVNVDFTPPDDWAEGGMGRSSQISNRITIRPGMDTDVEGGILLHEIIHMIAGMNNLSSIIDDETSVAVLANALNAFLRDNDLKYWRDNKADLLRVATKALEDIRATCISSSYWHNQVSHAPAHLQNVARALLRHHKIATDAQKQIEEMNRAILEM